MIASPFDELDYDYAASVAQKALRCMAAEHVPATADNFSVWFAYSMGVPSDLQRAINRDLFSTYVAAPDGSAAALATRALYLAKRSGRNRVVAESELDREIAAV